MSGDKTANTPSFYEIAAKIVTFCDEMDLAYSKRENNNGSGNNAGDGDDKRGLEI